MKIYTKSGDKGKTSLLGGQRVDKNHPKLDAYGTVDELNCHIGLLLIQIQNQNQKLKADGATSDLIKIQNHLFLLGSHIACNSEDDRKMYKIKDFSSANSEWIENLIDQLEEKLEPLKNFILPGGSLVSAQAHICRTVCRRAERLVSSLEDHEPIWLIYLNRLSDYFFVLARYLNHTQGIKDIIWVQN